MKQFFITTTLLATFFLLGCTEEKQSLDSDYAKTIAMSEAYFNVREAVGKSAILIAGSTVDLDGVEAVIRKQGIYKKLKEYSGPEVFADVAGGPEYYRTELAVEKAFDELNRQFDFRQLPEDFTKQIREIFYEEFPTFREEIRNEVFSTSVSSK